MRLLRSSWFVQLSLSLAVLLPTGAVAAPPDAGSILQQTAPTGLERLPQQAPELFRENRREEPPATGPKVHVRSFRVTGNAAIATEELAPIVAGSEGKELTLGELTSLAGRITGYYRDKGYPLARAIVPKQEVRDGVVEIQVIEGRLGKVEIRDQAELAAAPKGPLQGLKLGETVQNGPLERALLLMNEVPGIEVKSTLTPGATPGATDLLVDIKQGKKVDAIISFDNFGSRYSGMYRGIADLSINNPLSRGDQLTIRGMGGGSAGGTGYGRLAYQTPLGGSGLRTGVAVSYLHYELGDLYTPLGARGDTAVASLYALYPLVRTTRASLSLSGSYDYKYIEDRESASALATRKQSHSGTVTVSGDYRDGILGGGMCSLSLAYTPGALILDDQAAAVDATTARTGGAYNKFVLNLGHTQPIYDGVSLLVNFTLQRTDRNLDSSEKLQMGGVAGVRGFASSEAASDDGELTNVELRKQFGSHVLAGLFYDIGHGRINHRAFATDVNLRTIQATGANLTIFNAGDWAVKGQAAVRVGERATAEPDQNWRFWIQAVKYF